jgi:hypothetical protein
VRVLLQILTRFLNDTLVEDCRRCHPGFTHTDRQEQVPGSLPRIVRFCGLSPSDRHRGGLGPSEVDRGLGGHHLLGNRSFRWNPPAGVGPVVRVPPSSSARS